MSFFFLSFDLGFTEIYFSEKMEDIFKLKHSREHEIRADEWGLKLMHRAGFDLEECPLMIKSLDKGVVIRDIRLIFKDGGKSGRYESS